MNILNTTLLNIEGNEWTTRDACEGIICFGATGSGKSSGPLRHIALKYLEHNYGGIVFCAKPDEKTVWERYAAETGRSKDIMLLSQLSFNFLDYERSREGAGGGQIENIVSMFLEVVNIGKDKRTGSSNDEYWKNAVKQLLRNTISLIILAEESLTLENIKKVIDTAPRDLIDVENSEYCMYLIKKAIGEGCEGEYEFELTRAFFQSEFAQLDERTRSNTISSFTVVADALLRGELRRCFCSGASTLNIESTYREGKILIVDYDIMNWDKAGQYAAAIIKFCFQKMIQRREDISDDDARPIFLFADECQFFAIEFDQLFQTTARSSRVLTVYATQNLGNLQIGYGKERTFSLLGNLGTKFFCQNGDKETNEWAAHSIGQQIVKRRSQNLGDSKSSSLKGDFSKSDSYSEGWSEQKDFMLDIVEFTRLRKGGPQGQCRVGFVYWHSGKVLVNDSVYVLSEMTQKCKLLCGAKKPYKCKNIKKNGKGVRIGRKKLFMFKDYLWSILAAVSGGTMCYGAWLISTKSDVLYIRFMNFDVTKSLFCILTGTLCFYAISELICVLPAIINSFIKGIPREYKKIRKGLPTPGAGTIYLLASLCLGVIINRRLYNAENVFFLLGAWLIVALIFKFFRSSGNTEISD